MAEPECKLLELPREIRDMIYEDILIDNKTIDLCLCIDTPYPPRCTPDHPDYTEVARDAISLARTCQQLRDEVYEVFLSRNKFKMDTNAYHYDNGMYKLNHQPRKAASTCRKDSTFGCVCPTLLRRVEPLRLMVPGPKKKNHGPGVFHTRVLRRWHGGWVVESEADAKRAIAEQTKSPCLVPAEGPILQYRHLKELMERRLKTMFLWY